MRTTTLKKVLFFALALFFFSFSFGNHLTDRIMLSAHLNGQNEVPAVTTNASGVASFLLNATRDSMQVNVSVTGLSSGIIGAHIHQGYPGVNGPVLISLVPYIQGNIVRMVITGNDLSTNLSQFLSGALYINFHTVTNAGGEIRGQIEVESDYGYSASLSGLKQIPIVVTAAEALATLRLNRKMDSIEVNVVSNGLSGVITAAHLHSGDSLANGGVVLDLTSLINGSSLRGTVAFPSILKNDMDSGRIYINLHTSLNSGGEVRGQLEKGTGLKFDAVLTNDQETATPSVSNGYGTATFTLDPTFSSFSYDILVDSLSGPPTAAHFHMAPPGQSAGVIFSFGTITGNRITGVWSKTSPGTPLSDLFIGDILKGNFYVNVHTSANPSGELRGQIYKLGREGLIFELDPKQEVPPTSSSAQGGGMVSINVDETNLHYMMTVSGLTGPITAAHFHKEVSGQNGSVIFNLTTAFTNNSAFGYWDGILNPAFNSGIASAFYSDSMYVNVHTSLNPGGEARGQILRNYHISSTTGFEKYNAEGKIEVFPNPFSSDLSIRLPGTGPALITITDIYGKVIISHTLSGDQTAVLNDLNACGNGIYILTVKQGANSYISRVAKY